MHTYEHLNALVGSGSIIFNEEGEPFRQSHNLRGILDHSRARGVWRVHVDTLNDPPLGPGVTRPGALVTVFYRGGDVGKVYFSCGSNAVEWAKRRSAQSPRVSWWAGCEVTCKDWPAGSWPAFNQAREGSR